MSHCWVKKSTQTIAPRKKKSTHTTALPFPLHILPAPPPSLCNLSSISTAVAHINSNERICSVVKIPANTHKHTHTSERFFPFPLQIVPSTPTPPLPFPLSSLIRFNWCCNIYSHKEGSCLLVSASKKCDLRYTPRYTVGCQRSSLCVAIQYNSTTVATCSLYYSFCTIVLQNRILVLPSLPHVR